MKGLGAWAYSARSLGICQKKFRFALHVEQSMTLIQDVCLHDPRGVFLLVHIVMNWCLCCSILSDREIRTMAARLHELPLDLQVRVVLSCVLYGVNWNVFSQRTPRTRTHIHTRTHTHTNTHTRAAHTHTHTHTHTVYSWMECVFRCVSDLDRIGKNIHQLFKISANGAIDDAILFNARNVLRQRDGEFNSLLVYTLLS